MKKFFAIIFALLFTTQLTFAQDGSQTIRGTILDKQSEIAQKISLLLDKQNELEEKAFDIKDKAEIEFEKSIFN